MLLCGIPGRKSIREGAREIQRYELLDTSAASHTMLTLPQLPLHPKYVIRNRFLWPSCRPPRCLPPSSKPEDRMTYFPTRSTTAMHPADPRPSSHWTSEGARCWAVNLTMVGSGAPSAMPSVPASALHTPSVVWIPRSLKGKAWCHCGSAPSSFENPPHRRKNVHRPGPSRPASDRIPHEGYCLNLSLQSTNLTERRHSNAVKPGAR